MLFRSLNVSEEDIDKISKAILYHAGNIKKETSDKNLSIEARILRDADNIDAFGAIGLIRMISFCRDNNFPLFKSKEDWLNESVYGGVRAVISWQKSMLTKEGKILGEKRIRIMEQFLNELEREVNG